MDMMLNGLYVLTDEVICPGRTHLEIARAAIAGGARIVQIRDKNASDRDFYEAAMAIRMLTADSGVQFFVNDRVHIAAAVEADGVNVGQDDVPVAAARGILGPKAIIGLSCNCIEQAMEAESQGADYVGFGPVFPTYTKHDAGPVSGIETLRLVCEKIKLPVVAIGGIGASNIAEVAAAGATGAAVISAIVCADDMTAATKELVRRFRGN
jgi:thiamine-phosphate pyrophosphorylase